MDIEEVKKKFGFDPKDVGLRHRSWWICEEPDSEDADAGVKPGYLVVKARDGGGNEPDCDADSFGHYKGTFEDGFDITYRYYFYAPILQEPQP